MDKVSLFSVELEHGPLLVALAAVILVGLLWSLSRPRRISIAHIRGPPNPSRLLGNLHEYMNEPAGDLEVKWQEQFGAVYRFKAAFGEDRLMVGDPKAIQYILTAGDTFRRPFNGMIKLIAGPGLIWAEGEAHKRQRRVMNPAFALAELKQHIPTFANMANSMVGIWKKMIEEGDNKASIVINVCPWLSKTALDAIGLTAFGYDFNSLNEADNELAHALHGFFHKTESRPTPSAIFAQELIARLPESVGIALFNNLPTEVRRTVKGTFELSDRVARELVKIKLAALASGVGEKDILTLLVRSNQSSDPAVRMSDEELYAQLMTVSLAGHDTTANALSWTLYALACHPDVQSKVRTEILATKATAMSRGQPELGYNDFEGMSYLIAVLKETLRFYPPVLRLQKQAQEDTVIPLSKPIMTSDGNSITEIPVGKGQAVHIAMYGYNASKDIWGNDADVFRPERWLDGSAERKASNVGMYANLMSFSSGPKGCIGWRFSLLEIQAMLIEILSSFEVTIPKGAKPVRKEWAGVMVPVVEDERDKGPQVILEVKLVEAR